MSQAQRKQKFPENIKTDEFTLTWQDLYVVDTDGNFQGMKCKQKKFYNKIATLPLKNTYTTRRHTIYYTDSKKLYEFLVAAKEKPIKIVSSEVSEHCLELCYTYEKLITAAETEYINYGIDVQHGDESIAAFINRIEKKYKKNLKKPRYVELEEVATESVEPASVPKSSERKSRRKSEEELKAEESEKEETKSRKVSKSRTKEKERTTEVTPPRRPRRNPTKKNKEVESTEDEELDLEDREESPSEVRTLRTSKRKPAPKDKRKEDATMSVPGSQHNTLLSNPDIDALSETMEISDIQSQKKVFPNSVKGGKPNDDIQVTSRRELAIEEQQNKAKFRSEQKSSKRQTRPQQKDAAMEVETENQAVDMNKSLKGNKNAKGEKPPTTEENQLYLSVRNRMSQSAIISSKKNNV